MKKKLDIDFYKNGYTVDSVTCIDVSIAGAAGFFNYDNYFFYCYYFYFFKCWSEYSQLKGGSLLELSNRALHKLGLELKPNKVTNRQELLHTIKHHLDNHHPVLMIANYNTLFYYPEYKESFLDHGILINEYDSEKAIFGVLENLFTRRLVSANAFIRLQLTEEILADIWEKSSAIYKQKNSQCYCDSCFHDTLFSLERIGESQVGSYADILEDFIASFDYRKDIFLTFISNFNRYIQESNCNQAEELAFIRRDISTHLAVFFDVLSRDLGALKRDRDRRKDYNQYGNQLMNARSLLLSRLRNMALDKTLLPEDDVSRMMDEVQTSSHNFYMMMCRLHEEVKATREYYSKSIISLDLRKYLNNQGFGTNTSMNCKARFTFSGSYMLADTLPDSDVWIVGDMRFVFPPVREGCFDNISCMQQEIKPEPGSYKRVMLLGCADGGYFSETLVVLYENGHREALTVEFSNFSRSPVFGERIAWKGKGYRHDVGLLSYEPHIFAVDYFLEKSGSIQSLILPDCPNIHLFAISLGQ